MGKSIDFEVDTIETRPVKIPDGLFQFDIPKTASVWDDDLKVTVRNTEVTESHLREVVARAGGHYGWDWWCGCRWRRSWPPSPPRPFGSFGGASPLPGR